MDPLRVKPNLADRLCIQIAESCDSVAERKEIVPRRSLAWLNCRRRFARPMEISRRAQLVTNLSIPLDIQVKSTVYLNAKWRTFW